MPSHPIKRIAFAVVFFALGIALASPVFMGNAVAEPATLAQKSVSSAPVEQDVFPEEVSASQWSKCTPLNVAVFASRVHVKCSETVGGIQWFAAPTSNNSHAARVLSVLTAAHATGTSLDILYDPADTSGASIGCQTKDCRLIQGVAFLK